MNDEYPPGGDAGLAHLFRRTSRLMARAYHRRDHASHAQSSILSILREDGPMNQRDLLERLDVRSSSLSEVLAKLEAGGLVARERNPEDRRGLIISITPEGRKMLGDEPDRAGADGFFACLDDAEKEQLRGILTKIAATLRDDPMAGNDGFGIGPRGRGRFGRGPGRDLGREPGRGFGKGRGRR
ncbi:MAG: MarR family transcriptional regulator [Pseudodesulfovibrio sp.]